MSVSADRPSVAGFDRATVGEPCYEICYQDINTLSRFIANYGPFVGRRVTDGETRDDRAEPTRSGAPLLDAYRSLSELVPGMAPNASKRNVLVVLCALLGAALLTAVVASTL